MEEKVCGVPSNVLWVTGMEIELRASSKALQGDSWVRSSDAGQRSALWEHTDRVGAEMPSAAAIIPRSLICDPSSHLHHKHDFMKPIKKILD